MENFNKLKVGSFVKTNDNWDIEGRYAVIKITSTTDISFNGIVVESTHSRYPVDYVWSSSSPENYEIVNYKEKEKPMKGFIALDDKMDGIAPMRETKLEARKDVMNYINNHSRDPYIAEIRIIEQLTPNVKITKVGK